MSSFLKAEATGDLPSVLVIAGPTACGKTELSIEVAKRIEAEIISVDSRQIYRFMDIGTAKPTPEEQAQAPHHFIDICNPDNPYNAGSFSRQARKLIKDLWQRQVPVILVGGSGLYFQAVLDGFFGDETAYTSTRQQWQARLEAEGLAKLYDQLGAVDPVAQQRLEPADAPRILRALELATTGEGSLTQRWRQVPNSPLACRVLAFFLQRPRDSLANRINQRVDAMVAGGLLDEVENLVGAGYGADCWPMGTMGYKEILEYRAGAIDLEAAKALIKRRTQQYAKRQWTWFRRDRRLRWLDLDYCGLNGALDRVITQWEYYR